MVSPMSKGGLTPKQEKFAQVYVETGNASEAYRQAYSVKPGTKESSINVNASKLLADAKVSQRVAALQQKHEKRHEITVDKIRDYLIEDRQFARECKTPVAAVSASMGLAKLYGHLTEKVEHNVTADLAAILLERRKRVE